MDVGDLAKECGDLLHLHLFVPGGAETQGLKDGGGRNEGLVVSEPDGVSGRGVLFGEKVLKLADLEMVTLQQ